MCIMTLVKWEQMIKDFFAEIEQRHCDILSICVCKYLCMYMKGLSGYFYNIIKTVSRLSREHPRTLHVQHVTNDDMNMKEICK